MDDTPNPRTKQPLSQIIKNFLGAGFHVNEDVTEEEIISMVKEGHEQGTILASEAEMIHNIFEFNDKEAKDVMIHRKNMIAIDGETSFFDIVDFMIENGRSRYPVYMEDIDHIIGILHIKDAFAFFKRNEVFRSSVKDIDGLLREVDFVPETINVNTLFKKMQTEKKHMVIVVDEYGQTSGIVAMEDILEEIVGNIEDEYDEEEKQMIKKIAENTYRMDGMSDLADVIDTLHIPLEEDSFDTLSGLLISLLGKIPTDGEKYIIEAYGYRFEVLCVEDRMIREVEVSCSENKA